MWVPLSLAWAEAPVPTVVVGTVGAFPVRLVLPSAGGPGTLTYVRKGAAFGLTGGCGDRCLLTETGPDGAVTGRISASWTGGAALDGTWTTPDGTRTLPLHAESGPDAVVVWTRSEAWTRPLGTHKDGPVGVAFPVLEVVDPVVQARLSASSSVEALLGEGRDALLSNDWVDAVGYDLPLNRAGILAVVVRVEGSGAYPGPVPAPRHPSTSARAVRSAPRRSRPPAARPWSPA